MFYRDEKYDCYYCYQIEFLALGYLALHQKAEIAGLRGGTPGWRGRREGEGKEEGGSEGKGEWRGIYLTSLTPKRKCYRINNNFLDIVVAKLLLLL